MKVSKQNKDLAMMVLGISAGDIAAGFVGEQINKASFVPDSIKPYAPAGVQLLSGWLLATKVKQPLVKAGGIGMAAYGVKSLVSTLIPSIGGFANYSPAGTVGDVGATYNLAYSREPYRQDSGTNIVQSAPYNASASSVGGIGANDNKAGTF